MTQAVVQVRNIVARSGFANPLTLGVLVTTASYVKVYADDELLVSGADYELTGVGETDGVSIEIIGADDPDNYIGYETFTALYDPPLDQQVDLSSGGRLGASYEAGLDQQNRRIQALADPVGRALRLPPNMDVDGELPWPPSDGEVPIWDEATQRVIWGGPAGAAAASAAAAAASAAEAAAAEAAAELAEGNAETAQVAAEAAQAAAEAAAAEAEAAATSLLNSNNTWSGTQAFEQSWDYATPLIVRSTDSGANPGPWLNFERLSTSPAANDGLGVLNFRGNNSAGSGTDFAYIQAILDDPTNGTEDAHLNFSTRVNAGFVSHLDVGVNGGSRFNTAVTMTGPVGFTYQTTPANPPAGVLKLYSKADGKLYTLLPDGTETEVGSGSGGLPIAADRAALAALTFGAYDAAYLVELAREGMFLPDASDLSAEVTADTGQDVYVAPASDATGASGAWVRAGAVQSNFWENQTPRGRIHRLADRVFVGDAVVNDGQIPVVVEDWLEAFRSSTTTNAQFASLSTIGQIGVLGGSRTSDFNTPGSEGCIGGSFWSLNDNTVNLQSSYGAYIESVRYSGAGTTHGIEIDSVNNGSVVDVQPFGAYDHASGVTNALWLAAGGGYATEDSSVAVFILDNGKQFRKGIVFKSTALDTNVAIEMAKSQYINWVSDDGSSKAVIRADTTNAGTLQRLIFSNSGTFLQNSAGKTVLQVYNDAARVNGLQIVPGATTEPITLNATGDDTNINLDLAAKGTGTVRSSSGMVSSHATQGVGYRTGAGGAVTQATSKSTGVTLNKVCGQITTHNASLAANTTVIFTVTDSAVAATDVVRVSIGSGGTAGAYLVWVSATAAGSFNVAIRNITGGALGEALVLNFAVTKAVAA